MNKSRMAANRKTGTEVINFQLRGGGEVKADLVTTMINRESVNRMEKTTCWFETL